jgi:hypothetical protein
VADEYKSCIAPLRILRVAIWRSTKSTLKSTLKSASQPRLELLLKCSSPFGEMDFAALQN